MTKDLEIVKKNLKKWSHVIPFSNCKLVLRKNDIASSNIFFMGLSFFFFQIFIFNKIAAVYI